MKTFPVDVASSPYQIPIKSASEPRDFTRFNFRRINSSGARVPVMRPRNGCVVSGLQARRTFGKWRALEAPASTWLQVHVTSSVTRLFLDECPHEWVGACSFDLGLL
jgi:hypothetical protein